MEMERRFQFCLVSLIASNNNKPIKIDIMRLVSFAYMLYFARFDDLTNRFGLSFVEFFLDCLFCAFDDEQFLNSFKTFC